MRAPWCAALLVWGAVLFPTEMPAQSAARIPGPAITAVLPLALAPGEAATLRILGTNLSNARKVVFPGTALPPVPVHERKEAGLPKIFEMKEAGETQLEIRFTVPQSAPEGGLQIAVQCDGPRTPAVTLPLRRPTEQSVEKEPNDAFSEGNPIVENRPVMGAIQGEKDTDVYIFDAPAPGRFEATLSAAVRASLLDGCLAVYGPDHRLIAFADDTRGSDPVLRFETGVAGPHFLVVTDAADKGGVWSAYELTLHKLP
jgi:hypothetical protein